MKTPRILALSIASLVLSLPAFAVTDTWDGGDVSSNNFTVGANWLDNTAPVSDIANTDLIFGGAVRLGPTVNVAFSTKSLTFNNTAGAFIFGGVTLSVGTGGIVNNDADTMQFFNDVSFSGVANSTINAASGGLTFANTVSLASGTLTIDGAGATSFRNFSGTGALTKQGAGTMSWSPTAGANLFDLTVSAGTLNTVADGTIDLFSGTGSIALTGTGVMSLGEDLTLSGVTLTRASGAGLSIAATKQLRVEGGGDVIITGSFANNTQSELVVTGAGSTFSTTSTLQLNGGGSTNVLAGGSLSSGAAALFVGNTSNGLVTIDGSGSSVTGGNLDVGLNGGTGQLTFRNGSTGTFAGIDVDNSSSATTDGTLRVQSGASVTGTALTVAPVSMGNSGTVTVTGTGSVLTITGAGTTVVGAASASTGTLKVETGGTFNSGTGTTTVNATGTVAITGGTFNANGNMTLRGQLTRDLLGTFTLAAGRTLTVESGGDVSMTGAFTNTTASAITVTGTGSTFTTTAGLRIDNGSTLNVLAGGSVVATSGFIDIGSSGNGTATVDGAGSSLGGSLRIAQGANTGSMTFSNGGTGTFGSIQIANSSVAGSNGTLSIQSGALVSGTSLFLGYGGAPVSGTLAISGPGSAFSIAGGGSIFIGGDGGSSATLNVQSGGSFSTGTGPTVVGRTGTIAITGGTFNANGSMTVNGQVTQDASGVFNVASGQTLNVSDGGVVTLGGTFDLGASGTVNIAGGTLTVNSVPLYTSPWTFTSGAVNLLGPNNLTVGTGGLLGTDVTLPANRQLTVAGITTVDFAHTLLLDGGTLRTGALVKNGTLDFQKGTLAITGAGGFNIGTGALGSNVVLGAGANLQVTNTATVAAGATLTMDGGVFTAGVLANTGTLRANLGLGSVGTVTNSGGGRIFVGDTLTAGGAWTNAAGSQLTLQNSGLVNGAGTITNSGLVTGEGTIANPFNNASGGEVRGELGKTLAFTGTTGANAGRVNLLGGTVSFAQQFTNSATGQINGQGAIYFPTTPVPSGANPTAGLMNSGNINLSGGDSQIYGTVQLLAGSRLTVSGGATASFFDIFRHSGLDVKASAGSNIVFFSEVRGAGSFSGTGTIYFEGGYSPGNSPAAVTLGTGIVFGSANTLTLELGGLIAGSDYDQLILGPSGSLELDGGLVLVLIDDFIPRYGDTFQLLDFAPGQVSGGFDKVTLADPLPGDLTFDTSRLSTTGQITVVPEPGTGSLALLGAALLGLRRRRDR